MNEINIQQLKDEITGGLFASSVHWNSSENTLMFRYPLGQFEQQYKQQLEGNDQFSDIQIQQKVLQHKISKDLPYVTGIKNIIAVASGKGGVGKSTTTVMLANQLQQLGARVGILDADIYGPSIPTMMGVHKQPESPDNKSFLPVIANGIQTMSLGFLLDQKAPAIWRGAMVTKAMMQMLEDTRWDDLDYLLIDLPPGTGDIQLTMIQKIPLTAAVIVTTPQDISMIDAHKALAMFNKVDIPVLGIIENMSSYVCQNCGHEAHLFGQGGGEKMAQEFTVELLGKLPLNIDIMKHMDQGSPEKLWNPQQEINQIGMKIALKTVQNIAKLPISFDSNNKLKLHF